MANEPSGTTNLSFDAASGFVDGSKRTPPTHPSRRHLILLILSRAGRKRRNAKLAAKGVI